MLTASSKVSSPVFDAGVMAAELSASREAEEAGELPSCMLHHTVLDPYEIKAAQRHSEHDCSRGPKLERQRPWQGL